MTIFENKLANQDRGQSKKGVELIQIFVRIMLSLLSISEVIQVYKFALLLSASLRRL